MPVDASNMKADESSTFPSLTCSPISLIGLSYLSLMSLSFAGIFFSSLPPSQKAIRFRLYGQGLTLAAVGAAAIVEGYRLRDRIPAGPGTRETRMVVDDSGELVEESRVQAAERLCARSFRLFSDCVALNSPSHPPCLTRRTQLLECLGPKLAGGEFRDFARCRASVLSTGRWQGRTDCTELEDILVLALKSVRGGKGLQDLA
ncbi:hypothetical protein M427DRAFT_486429 [Gonapodya prolifera JEL478]|uniref:Uncharacterized protein n=1 Tax=Gonapodya prolifera (strain JEL478) TaxID=1344416 RepID=A0A139B0I9_GONPJ|nr:hypothetical protein M427DRAFT_486429 [Gonapodya prolifera JEL478]|eukprot:KXS22494.1 hypothetical protein M427DRAFT_486429 [Gonapodya prolifera JEL478]